MTRTIFAAMEEPPRPSQHPRSTMEPEGQGSPRAALQKDSPRVDQKANQMGTNKLHPSKSGAKEVGGGQGQGRLWLLP